MDKNKVDYGKMNFATRAIKYGEGPDPTTHALNTPIYETTTYAYNTTDEYDQMIGDAMSWKPGCCIYSRTTNPTTMAMERKVASLENAEDACVVSCGMAAVSLALLTQLNAGDHVICSDDTFICTASMFEDILPSKGIETDRVEILDLENIKKAIKPNTKVIYLEALSNPLLKLADLPAIAELAHAHGCKFIVDNTFLSPFIMRPLDLGADIVVHSGTKYYVGHGDGLCGIVAGKKADMDRIRYYNDNLGTHISPFDAWLALRGVRTLRPAIWASARSIQTSRCSTKKTPTRRSDRIAAAFDRTALKEPHLALRRCGPGNDDRQPRLMRRGCRFFPVHNHFTGPPP